MESIVDGVVSPIVKGPKVLADGTYATESAYSKAPTSPIFDQHRKASLRGIF